MNNSTSKKMGELRGRKKSKSHKKLSKRKVRYLKEINDHSNQDIYYSQCVNSK